MKQQAKGPSLPLFDEKTDEMDSYIRIIGQVLRSKFIETPPGRNCGLFVC